MKDKIIRKIMDFIFSKGLIVKFVNFMNRQRNQFMFRRDMESEYYKTIPFEFMTKYLGVYKLLKYQNWVNMFESGNFSNISENYERQSGKTYVSLSYMLTKCLMSNEPLRCIYIGQNMNISRQNIFDCYNTLKNLGVDCRVNGISLTLSIGSSSIEFLTSYKDFRGAVYDICLVDAVRLGSKYLNTLKPSCKKVIQVDNI